MSIAVNCPTCGKSYNLNESMVGKKVRCKHCADTFPVELDSVLPVNGAAPPANSPGITAQPGGSLPLAVDPVADLPEVVRVTGGDGNKEPKKKGFPVFWVVTAGIACALLLVCGGIGTGAFLIIRNVMRTANEIATIGPGGSGISPVRPKTLADAVADVKSMNSERQKQGAEWLAKAPVDPAQRSKVGQALEARLNDINPDVKAAAANALVTWAGPENVPALVKCVDMEDPNTIEPAVKALVAVHDPKAIPAIARLLPTGRRALAANALASFGPACEPEVVKFAFYPDQGTRDEAQRLLRGYGTKDEVIVVQALADLKTTDSNRRMSAALWFSRVQALARFRNEVSAALNTVLKDGNDATRNNAVRAVQVWATGANVPTLIDLLNDPNWHNARDLRGILVSTLTDLKDARAAAVFCKDLATRDHYVQAQHALEVLGPVAESEVVKNLHHPDGDVRQRVADLLNKYGTKPEVLIAQTVADLKFTDNNRRIDALLWLSQTAVVEKQRDEVSAALNPLLKEKNEGIRHNAIKAMRVWATKANGPTLIEILADANSYHLPRELRTQVIATLADLKDEKAAALFCKDLSHNEWHEKAYAALEALGPAAEADVLKYLHHPDAATRTRAAELLKKYGTKDEAIFKQTVADLSGPEPGRKLSAATALASLPLDEMKRALVSSALDPLLSDKDGNVQLAATKAAKVWATKDNVPALIKFINSQLKGLRPSEATFVAIEVLVALKDERAYWPIAESCSHPFRWADGRKYLGMIGVAAEPEVAKHLLDKTAKEREKAWVALSVVGSKEKLNDYETAAKAEMDGNALREANNALKAIKGRQK